MQEEFSKKEFKLPESDLSAGALPTGQAGLAKAEEQILAFWDAQDIFAKSLEKTKNGKPFTFYDGPPFATGTPHYGSLLSSIIKDVVGRYQTMRGRFVRRRWGWDCHGLPIEEIVERELGISGKKKIEEIGIGKFNETCRKMVLQYVAEWRKMIRRIARWVDFDNSYKTMDRDYMESVWWAFKQLYEKGLVYEGRKVLLYCPRCETPVSNFEVAMDNSYKTITEESVIVKFSIINSQFSKRLRIPNNTPVYLLAWTTTPWTLPGNVALAVGEKIAYAIFRNKRQGTSDKEIYIVAKERLDAVVGKGDFEVIKEINGKDLIGMEYEPLFNVPAVQSDKTFKVYAADFVNTDEGTGIVHTAVVYGEDDYNLGIKERLPVVPLLDERGIFNDKAPELVRGQYFKKADKIVMDDLAARHLLFARAAHTHSYPHCWRCETALFYNAIPAWFVNIQKIKLKLLKSNEKEINWFPAHLKFGRYAKSVEQAPDWNISRNRYWGNPIPVWKCQGKGQGTRNKEQGGCGNVIVVGSIRELGLGTNTLYFARHGLAETNVRVIHSAYMENDPIDLVDEGVRQTEEMAKQLKKQGGIDLIVSSDVRRAKHTAEIIAKALKCPVEYDARLREWNLGIWNGKPCEGMHHMLPFEKRWTEAPEGGETWTELQKRMVVAVSDVNQKNRDKRILVISHGDPLWVLRQYFGSEKGYPEVGEFFEMNADIDDLHRPGIDEVVLKCPACGGTARRVKEIFDSWMEAGSMPFAEYHYPFEQKETFESRLPAQFVAEYIPQTRAWFYVMHVLSVILFGRAPFENVVTTGTVLAEDGAKMSKSKRNYPDPGEVIAKYGADSLRLYLMHSPVMQAEDLNFSVRDIEALHRRVVLILSNVRNYFVTYAREAMFGVRRSAFERSNFDPRSSNNTLDIWINARTKELVSGVTEHMDAYDTVRATRVIEDYVTDLSTWYVRRSRGRKDGAFFETLYESLLTTSKVIAPLTPYLAEHIFKSFSEFEPRTSNLEPSILSVHLADWPEKEKLTKEETALLRDMAVVRDLASKALAVRKAQNLPVRQPLQNLRIKSQKLRGKDDLLAVLAEEINVKRIEIDSKFPDELALDVTVTEELKLEGLVRGLERIVQELRKTQGFKVGEQAALFYETADAGLEAAIRKVDKKKTYLKSIERGKKENASNHTLEGKDITLALEKV
ncbi:MAG: class I tRNA ligase family protein [Candidatus Liptonbacteria bacterium]|nr:class I tRNA ligase family protein [Candidatus Liptonbacteria bacterium]